MTDREVLARFMDPSEENSDWWPVSVDGEPEPLERWSLDALHEVEARLKRVAPAQWEHYITRTIRAIGILADDLIHASAEQKTKSLAEVLRPVVEKK